MLLQLEHFPDSESTSLYSSCFIKLSAYGKTANANVKVFVLTVARTHDRPWSLHMDEV